MIWHSLAPSLRLVGKRLAANEWKVEEATHSGMCQCLTSTFEYSSECTALDNTLIAMFR